MDHGSWIMDRFKREEKENEVEEKEKRKKMN